MSRKYKMNNSDGTCFVSFTRVYWIDVFILEIYFQAIIQSLAFCRKDNIRTYLFQPLRFCSEWGIYIYIITNVELLSFYSNLVKEI